uniref:Uncharacterized protein n=1 Tax=Caenorhabditis japonica TaxID=281687 RepID=A0A8R1EFU3_CAEJA
MFPEDIISSLSQESVDYFLEAISDQSDEGMFISEAERKIIGEKGLKLIQLWNLTVKTWTSGKTPTERLGISHQEATLLVSAADKIKSISRQNVAQDPFSMLHGYMERMLETGETEQKECAKSTVFIDKTEVEEDGQIMVQVFIQNRANITLTNVGVSMSFVKSDLKTHVVNFNNGPSWSAGISSLTGLGTLSAGSSFEIHWTRFVAVPSRLTSIAKYQDSFQRSCKVIGRALDEDIDIFINYTKDPYEKAVASDDLLHLAQVYLDETWTAKRLVTGMAFSEHYPDLLAVSYGVSVIVLSTVL